MRDVTKITFGFLARRPQIYFVAAFWVLTNALMFPLLMKLQGLSGTPIPDVIPGHDAATLHSVFAAYGAEGMEAYQRVALYDTVYPVAYALLFGALVYMLWHGSAVRHLAWLPVIAAVIDYVENYYLGLLLRNMSNIIPAVASLSGSLVAGKMLLIGFTMLTLLVGVVLKLGRRARSKRIAT